ncbi:J domain-containing protein [Cyanobium gracile UHCC 0139]|uniref:J domain-containing protein n=1 Tax=Cyanobium gracile UHCC 0139 TaxID=3110308 RepID=A0ABU5RWM2_9CYAN|nr:J domain-containing protein [Cyanobium gracile]MEA5392121.1 J domain-containing protein [Cyanobium gracile UHCC 0139]
MPFAAPVFFVAAGAVAAADWMAAEEKRFSEAEEDVDRQASAKVKDLKAKAKAAKAKAAATKAKAKAAREEMAREEAARDAAARARARQAWEAAQARAAAEAKKYQGPAWAEALGIPSGTQLTLELVQRHYRQAVMRTHPDRGGSPAAFHMVQSAWETAKQELA